MERCRGGLCLARWPDAHTTLIWPVPLGYSPRLGGCRAATGIRPSGWTSGWRVLAEAQRLGAPLRAAAVRSVSIADWRPCRTGGAVRTVADVRWRRHSRMGWARGHVVRKLYDSEHVCAGGSLRPRARGVSSKAGSWWTLKQGVHQPRIPYHRTEAADHSVSERAPTSGLINPKPQATVRITAWCGWGTRVVRGSSLHAKATGAPSAGSEPDLPSKNIVKCVCACLRMLIPPRLRVCQKVLQR